MVTNLILNAANLDVARKSGDIATATQRDSGSMIAISFITMVFLPITSVASIFGMAFFTLRQNDIQTWRDFWIFWVITLPLTALVFLVYAWYKARNVNQRNAEAIRDKRAVFTRRAWGTSGVE